MEAAMAKVAARWLLAHPEAWHGAQPSSAEWLSGLLGAAFAGAVASSSGAPSPGADPLEDEASSLTLCSKLLLTVCSPDETLFAEVGGAPAEPPPERARAAQQWRSTACQALSLAATLLECATRLELSAVQPAGGASRPSQAGAGASQQPAAFPAIVELPSGSGGEEASVAQEAQAEVVRRCLLACAMYGLDGELPGQWSDAACDTAAQALLARCALAASLPQLPPSQRLVESCSSLALLDAAAAQQQELLAAALPRLLLPPLRSVLLQPPGDKPAPASTIPHSTFTRTLAARQLAWLVRRLVHPFLGAQLPVLLPLVLACADEGAPSVAWQGLEALRHISQEALPSELRWQRELLLDSAKRAVVGCREELWPVAFGAAAALVVALEGAAPRAAGYHMLAGEMLTEVERNAFNAARRCTFMAAMQPLLRGMGLAGLRHCGRLMPLLLEWLQAEDAPSRLAAAQLLALLVQMAWPRLASGPQGAALLQHAQQAQAAEGRRRRQAGGAALDAQLLAALDSLCALLLDACSICKDASGQQWAQQQAMPAEAAAAVTL